MKINKSSWHYKFREQLYVRFGGRNQVIFDKDHRNTNNGCLYLRDVFIWSWVAILFTAVCFASVILMGVVPIIAGLLWVFEGYNMFIYNDLVISSMGLFGIMIGIIISVISVMVFVAELISKQSNGLVSEGIRAVKSKVCPIIEYTNE